MNQKAIYPSISSMMRCVVCATLSCVFLCACTSDNAEDELTTTLHVTGFLSDVTDATRAIPTGYTAFAEPYDSATADKHQIGIFITRLNGTQSYGVFDYTADNQWTSQVQVKTGVDHYIYGFMPTSAIGSSQISTLTSQDFSAGATLTLSDIPAVTAKDVCIVTGVAKGAVKDSVQSIDDPTLTLTPGNFTYHASYTNNYLYLLFNHLYSRVNIKLAVGTTYNNLRTIKITKLDMATISGADNFTATVSLTAGSSTPMGTPTFTGSSSTAGCSATLYSSELELDTTEQTVPAYVCPDGQKQFRLTVRYDVYDKSGNLLANDRQATNTFTLKDIGSAALTSMTAGKSYELPVTVEPSFLYQISDADLNNPTIH